MAQRVRNRDAGHEVWSDDQIKTYLEDRHAYACKQALQVQNACNLSGVVLSFARAMQDVRNYLSHTGASGAGWAGLRKHPAMILWVDKIND